MSNNGSIFQQFAPLSQEGSTNSYLADMVGFSSDYYFGNSNLFDMLRHDNVDIYRLKLESVVDPSCLTGESSEVVSAMPTTPNSVSISLSEEEVENRRGGSKQNLAQQENSSHKQLKPKKKSQKRQKEPRIAFKTKTEIDHLDDGYRWRKYGQKAVKNSPFPRSYFRCTTATCGVKKRVERCCDDPSNVVTTYEGRHIHPCPVMTRVGGFGYGFGLANPILDQRSTGFIGNETCTTLSSSLFLPLSQYHHNLYQQQSQSQFHSNNLIPASMTVNFNTPKEQVYKHVKDDGLLQDIVQFNMQCDNEQQA